MQIVLVFAVAFIAALLSSMSGGGAGIILFPSLLLMGFSYPLVAAISAVDSVFWVLPAARNYLKGRKIHWTLIIVFSLVGLIGCYLGVLLLTHINQRILEICVGALIVFLVVYTYFRKGFGMVKQTIYSRTRRAIAYPFSLLLGFYETVFGSGNGILFTTLTFYTNGFDFIDGLSHYYVISFSWALFAAILLAKQGYYNVPVMAAAAIGSVAGGYLGSHYAKRKGNAFIRLLFVIIGGILGCKMLLGL